LNGKDEELTSILSVFPSFSNKKDNKNKTPLHFAIEGNHPSTCEILLDLGVDMFIKRSQYEVRSFNFHLVFIFLLEFSSYLLWKFLSKSRNHQTYH